MIPVKLKIFFDENDNFIWNLLTLSLCLLLIWALTLTGLVYFIKNMLVNNVITDTMSPNGKYKAIAFIRNGGATTDFSPQVSVLEAYERFGNKNTGNVFIGYNNQYIDSYWEDNKTLVVVHNCFAADIFMQEDEINDIKIIYRLAPYFD